jgi:uncharacterized protein YjeT (DUF2065 family)
MDAFRCPVCDASLPRQEAADGWCESCGKRLPLALVHRAEGIPGHNRYARSFEDRSDLSVRFAGLFALAIGSCLTYWGIYGPLASAIHHEWRVSLSMKGIVFSPLCLIFGLIMIALGKRGEQLLSRWGILLGVPLLGIGLVAYFMVKATVESYGYRF